MTNIKITVVSYQEFAEYDFMPPATFFIMDSMQNYHFIHTRDRKTAQDWVDEHFGKGRYTVKASKIQKGNGERTAVGHQTRRGQRK